jgi:hypothetical protein
MKKKYVAKKISAGHYIYRGIDIYRIGYYPPEKRVVWECVDENGNGFGHDYSLKGCKFWIDEDFFQREKYKIDIKKE